MINEGLLIREEREKEGLVVSYCVVWWPYCGSIGGYWEDRSGDWSGEGLRLVLWVAWVTLGGLGGYGPALVTLEHTGQALVSAGQALGRQ